MFHNIVISITKRNSPQKCILLTNDFTVKKECYWLGILIRMLIICLYVGRFRTIAPPYIQSKAPDNGNKKQFMESD